MQNSIEYHEPCQVRVSLACSHVQTMTPPAYWLLALAIQPAKLQLSNPDAAGQLQCDYIMKIYTHGHLAKLIIHSLIHSFLSHERDERAIE